MRIALFDYSITSQNPAGSCHLALLRSLAREHSFTVFSVEFDNPDPERIIWIRVRVPKRPLALLFLSFHLVAPLLYLWHRLTKRTSFDLIQSVESNLAFGELIYAHFSHTTYLRTDHAVPTGLRQWWRWLDHTLHAIAEPFRFSIAKYIVVPSRGLKRDLQSDFGVEEDKISVISNPISVDNLPRPECFDRGAFRSNIGLDSSDVVCVFCALGHFERKGLPQLLEALRSPVLNSLKVLVIGGNEGLIKAYSARASHLRVDSKMRFLGFQHDVRPFLWSADAFILPSSYETFSLAAYEAAAAGLPVIAPALNGICDLLVDGQTGFVIEPSVASITHGLERLLQTPPDERMAIGARAQEIASSYSIDRFIESWRMLYQHWPPYAGKFPTPTPERVPPACQ